MACLIKICGLTRPADIEAVNTARPDYIGFIFAKSRSQIDAAAAAHLREKLSPDITPVGVFVNESIDKVAQLVHNGVIDAIQLHGDEDEDYIQTLKSQVDAPIIKAISVQQPGDVQKRANTCADYILLDSKGGGTGKAFDWDLIGDVPRKFFLAGGLNANNVEAAINKIHPYAVDASSGVETNGQKDPEKIMEFIRRVRHENISRV